MRWTTLCLLAATIAVSAISEPVQRVFAEELQFSQASPTPVAQVDNTPIPAQPGDVPTTLEVVAQTANGVQYTVPTGNYQLLAQRVVTRLKRDNEKINIQTLMTVPTAGEKARLVCVSPDVEAVTITFQSNCAVNSQFNVSPAVVTAKADEDENADRSDLNKLWLTDVLAHWTVLNHAWNDPGATVPKTYRASNYTHAFDISFDRREVITYNQAVAAKAKSNAISVANR